MPTAPSPRILPVNEVFLIAAEIALNAEFSGNRPPWKGSRRDRIEVLEEPANIAMGLCFTPRIARIEIDLIDAFARARLDAVCVHRVLRDALRAITVSALSAWYALSGAANA